MAAFIDLCRFIVTAGGTTDWVYSSAVGGCQSPSAAGATAGQTYKVYACSADLTQWEVSEGVYSTTGGGTFPRTTVLYNSAGTGTAAGQSGAGTKISFTVAPNVSVVALKEDISTFSTAAMMATPAAPSGGSTSNTGVMMGLGSVWTITPGLSTRVEAFISLVAQNSTAGGGCGVTVYYGTGTAPVNGAALTGTAVGARQFGQSVSAGANVPFSQEVFITGLAKGVPIWMDVALTNGGSATGTISNITVKAKEF